MSYTNPCQDNQDALSEKRIVFLCDRIASIHGSLTENQLMLKNFFVPIESSVFSSFVLPASTPSYEVSYSNLTDPAMVFVLVSYDSDIADEDMYIEWSTNGSTWHPLGKMLALTGTTSLPLEALYLKNDLTTPVSISMIVAK